MKLILSLLLLTTAGCASSNEDAASEPPAAAPSNDSDRAARVERFVVALDARTPLSGPQKTTVHTVMTEHLEQLEPHLRAISSQSSRRDKAREARKRKPQIDAIRAATESKMKAALDSEQFAAYVALREELRQEFRARARG